MESAYPPPYKRSTSLAVAISFWATIGFFVVSYISIAFYAHMPLPLRLVTGTSMEPNLYAGDIIMLKALPFAQIKRGDLVAYRSPRSFKTSASGRPDTILHRVIDVDKGDGVLTTKGDNSSVDPWPITPDIIEGKQVLRIPNIGRPILLLTNAKGAIFLSSIVLVGSIVASSMLIYSAASLKIPKVSKKDELH